MLSCRLQCALAALCIVLALGGVTGAPSDPRLRQFLQKSLAAATGKQLRKWLGLSPLGFPRAHRGAGLPVPRSQSRPEFPSRVALRSGVAPRSLGSGAALPRGV